MPPRWGRGVETHENIAAGAKGLRTNSFLGSLGNDAAMSTIANAIAQALASSILVAWWLDHGGAFGAESLDHLENSIARIADRRRRSVVEQHEARAMDHPGGHVEGRRMPPTGSHDGVGAVGEKRPTSRPTGWLAQALPRSPW